MELSGISVDSGSFYIGDKLWFVKNGADPSKMKDIAKKGYGHIIKCDTEHQYIEADLIDEDVDLEEIREEAGKGTIWEIGCFADLDPIERYIHVPSKELWVVDPCYVIPDEEWQDHVKTLFDENGRYVNRDTVDHFNVPNGIGDGTYTINIDLTGMKGEA